MLRGVALQGRFRSHTVALLLVLAVTIMILGAIVGLSRGNDLRYIVGDSFRLFTTAVAIHVASSVSADLHRRLSRAIIIAAASTELVRLAAFILAQATGAYVRIGGISPVFVGLLIAGEVGRNLGWSRMKYGIVVLATTTNLLTALVRSLWMAAVMQIAVFAAISLRDKGTAAVRVVVTSVSVVALAVCVMIIVNPGFGERLTDRVAATSLDFDSTSSDGSVTSRLNENASARSAYAESGSPPLGMGSGAAYQLDYFEEHHIHSTRVSLLIRYGWIGGIAWYMLMAVAVASVLIAFRTKDQSRRAWCIGAVGVIAVSEAYYSFVGSFLAAWAITSALSPAQKEEKVSSEVGEPE